MLLRVGIALSMFGTLAFLGTPAVAQELRGSVRGTVSDSSGSVVAGARIALRNAGTGVEVQQATNSAGQYVFDFVSPGTYSVSVSLEGFRGFVQENVANPSTSLFFSGSPST